MNVNLAPTAYVADRTAQLIVDPYNDFMSEGGKLYAPTKETAEAVGMYENLRKLIPAIRAAHIQGRHRAASPLARRRLQWVEAYQPIPSADEPGPALCRRHMGRRIPAFTTPRSRSRK